MEKITISDALALLDKLTSGLKLDRNEHFYVISALRTLNQLNEDYEKLSETLSKPMTATVQDSNYFSAAPKGDLENK